MLNKLLQKSRNTRLEKNSSSQNRPLSIQEIPLNKKPTDHSKESQSQMMNSQTLKIGITTNSTQRLEQQIAQSIPTSIIHSASPVSQKFGNSKTRMNIYDSQYASSSSSVSILTNATNIIQTKQKQPLQLSNNIDQQYEVAQENSQINTPQPIKYKMFEIQTSIKRAATNLNNMDEFKEFDQKRNSLVTNYSSKKEEEYQNTIKKLQNKISQLVQELEKQTSLSKQTIEDSSSYCQKYQSLKDSSKLNSLCSRSDSITQSTINPQQDFLSQMQVLEIQDENKKLKIKYQQSLIEQQQWRDKYENFEKQQENNEDRLKEKLKDQYTKEIQVLNNELSKYKSQQFGVNKSKKSISLIKSNNNILNNNINSNILKDNSNKISSTLTDDWHQNYMMLKDEKEKIEKLLKNKIESLQEQNIFLQNEVNQLHKKTELSHEFCSQPINKKLYDQNQDPHFQNLKSCNLSELNIYFSQNLN